MSDMLGIILTSGKVALALTAIGALLVVFGRFLWSIHKFTIRVEKSHDALLKLIGTNGGKTLFERLDEVERAVIEIRGAIKAQDAKDLRYRP